MIASSPAAVGWNGAGSRIPCTHGWSVHSSWPSNRGWTTENPKPSAPCYRTAFIRASSTRRGPIFCLIF